MILTLIVKELKLTARDRSFRFAVAGYLVVLLVASMIFFQSFLKSGNYPFPAISSLLLFRISMLQGALLAALTPWFVLKMHDQDLSDESRPIGIGTLAAPWKVLVSKLIATAICLANLMILALPVFSLMRLMGAASSAQVGWIFSDMFLFLMVLTVLVFHLRLRFRSWLYSWISSYAALGITGLVYYWIWSTVGRQPCSIVFLLLLVSFAALLIPHGNRALLYERN